MFGLRGVVLGTWYSAWEYCCSSGNSGEGTGIQCLKMRQDLAGEEFHAFSSEIVRQRSRLTAGQEDTATQVFQMLREFLANRGRAADNREDAFLHVVPSFLLGEKKRAVLDNGQRR